MEKEFEITFKYFWFAKEKSGFWYLMSRITGELVIYKGMKIKQFIANIGNCKYWFSGEPVVWEE